MQVANLIPVHFLSPVYMRVPTWIQPRFASHVNTPNPDCNPD